jgi:hypothetical protein
MKLVLLSILLFAGDLAGASSSSNLRDQRGDKKRKATTTTTNKSSCGCSTCTDDVLARMAGAYSCGDRINWLQTTQGGRKSELDACKQVSGEEFRGICGPMCDPDRCNLAPTPATPYPTYVSAAPSPLYCFPPEGSRETFENVWDKYTVQVKEDASPCGPGNNLFSKSAVSKTGNEVTLKFQKKNGRWEGSEVRIVLPGEKYTYGNYRFHVKSVDILDSSQNSISNILPKEMVLGLFTWDDTERYDVHENYNHEVDIEVSRWGAERNSDIQFLMQPPGNPQMYRFFSGPNQSYSQSNQWHSFEWLPSKISWESTSGGGKTHEYTTEAAVKSGRRDYIQCLPAEMEVRMNLWNMYGAKAPLGMSDRQYIEVVIDAFEYEPATVMYVEKEGYCSKHCQCEGSCVDGKCSGSNPTPPNPAPQPSPTPSKCGCSTCTDDVLNTMADGYSCGDRINWLQAALGKSELDACKQVSGKEFPKYCDLCDPNTCNNRSNEFDDISFKNT